MAQASISAMDAHAMVLLSRSDRWAKAVRHDGRVFTLFAGSTGKTYWTTEVSCSCPGFEWRQNCAHRTAVVREAEKARELATRRPRYENPHDLAEVF